MSKKKKEEIIRFRLEFFDDMIKQIRCRIDEGYPIPDIIIKKQL